MCGLLRFLRTLSVHCVHPGVSESEAGLSFGLAPLAAEETRRAMRAWVAGCHHGQAADCVLSYFLLARIGLELPSGTHALAGLASFCLRELVSSAVDERATELAGQAVTQ